jgi:hypothetical protein
MGFTVKEGGRGYQETSLVTISTGRETKGSIVDEILTIPE